MYLNYHLIKISHFVENKNKKINKKPHTEISKINFGTRKIFLRLSFLVFLFFKKNPNLIPKKFLGSIHQNREFQ